MKRTLLTTAVIGAMAAGLGASPLASAVFLNPAGLGELLVYPYYTVNGSNSTAVTVVNTTYEGKALKVRFLEATTAATCWISICTCHHTMPGSGR